MCVSLYSSQGQCWVRTDSTVTHEDAETQAGYVSILTWDAYIRILKWDSQC